MIRITKTMGWFAFYIDLPLPSEGHVHVGECDKWHELLQTTDTYVGHETDSNRVRGAGKVSRKEADGF